MSRFGYETGKNTGVECRVHGKSHGLFRRRIPGSFSPYEIGPILHHMCKVAIVLSLHERSLQVGPDEIGISQDTINQVGKELRQPMVQVAASGKYLLRIANGVA